MNILTFNLTSLSIPLMFLILNMYQSIILNMVLKFFILSMVLELFILNIVSEHEKRKNYKSFPFLTWY